MRGADMVDGVLAVGGLPLPLLAERVGQTPFYAYDRARITERVRSVRGLLPDGALLHYAVKANPMPALLAHVARQVDGMDVASAGELKAALDAGCAPHAISFAGPGKREAELRQAVAAGVLIHLESEREAECLAAAARSVGRAARVAVRVNPDFEVRAAGMRMGGGAQVFGVDLEQVPSLLGRMRPLGLAFEGFHVYAGSQFLKAELWVSVLHRTVDMLLGLAAGVPGPVHSVNLGGGWGIPYTPRDEPLDMGPVADALAIAVPRLRQAWPQARVTLELGRYLVGEAGVYVTRVIERKVSRGQVFLVTDGGLHHHLAATGNLGQVIHRAYPMALARCPRPDASGVATEEVQVAGPLCTPLDTLGRGIVLPVAKAGDLLVVFQSGAYGATASPQAFLSHPPCPEVLV